MSVLKMSADGADVIPNGNWPYGATRPKEDKETRLRLLEWARANELQYDDDARCVHWLTEEERCTRLCCGLSHMRSGWLDHITGWTRHGVPYMLLCQPYHLSARSLQHLAACAALHGLNIEINGDGWYGSGTIAIELTPAPATDE